jgi:flagellar basal-body rod modification protein FlgD
VTIDGTAPISDAAAATLARLQAEQAAANAKLVGKTTATSVDATDTMGKDTFLKLLVAQLKYQNPMQPSDPSAFMAQTAQFSMVEKLQSMEKATTDMLTSERSRAATGLLGNQVTWVGNDGKDTSGVVTGVRMGSDGPTLEVGDKDVPYASVTRVTAAPAASKPAATTGTTPASAPLDPTAATSVAAPAA